MKRNTENDILARRHSVNIHERTCDCGLWIQYQQPCTCALAVCNHFEIKDFFNENFFGRELLTETWKALHNHPTLITKFPGDNVVFTTVAEVPVTLQSHCQDITVTHSQKRYTSSGEDSGARASISVAKSNKSKHINLYLIIAIFNSVLYFRLHCM